LHGLVFLSVLHRRPDKEDADNCRGHHHENKDEDCRRDIHGHAIPGCVRLYACSHAVRPRPLPGLGAGGLGGVDVERVFLGLKRFDQPDGEVVDARGVIVQ